VIRAAVLALTMLVACKGGDKHTGAGSAAPAGSGSNAGSAAASAAGSNAGSAAIDPAMHNFCVRSMQQIGTCFDDDAFWDAHATAFFAAQKRPIDPADKKRWIGIYKDSFASLVRGREIEKNCDVMLAENQLPTQQQMDLVDQARQQSCAAFGGALGYVLYTEGAFYKPRDGVIPPAELMPSPAP
jgi:hypothetical protein